jgi:hypothetical protein
MAVKRVEPSHPDHKVALEQEGSVVQITLICQDEQEASVVFDSISSQLLDGKRVVLEFFGPEDKAAP